MISFVVDENLQLIGNLSKPVPWSGLWSSAETRTLCRQVLQRKQRLQKVCNAFGDANRVGKAFVIPIGRLPDTLRGRRCQVARAYKVRGQTWPAIRESDKEKRVLTGRARFSIEGCGGDHSSPEKVDGLFRIGRRADWLDAAAENEGRSGEQAATCTESKAATTHVL